MNDSLGEKKRRTSETAAHLALKRLALLWAQENGFPIAALEVSLPRCRYRADVAAYRPEKNDVGGATAIFECKQSAPDLRRDDCQSAPAFVRLESVYRRRQILEKNLRVHYPTLRTGDSLFPEWESYDFSPLEHRGYARVTRELIALQRRLGEGRKFEKLARYACANLCFLVLPNELVRESETPLGWGLLVENSGAFELRRKPVWRESPEATRLHVLQKIAAAGTRAFNRQLGLAPVRPEFVRQHENTGATLAPPLVDSSHSS
ncbi:MAG TPA: hypothetical protein VGG02_14210 [Chthoniobacterales bacterium]|jgi:hypothetical protein